MIQRIPSTDQQFAVKRPFWLIWIAPVLVFLSLAAWVFATPIGSSPDEDYHLNSIWCGQGIRDGLCEAGKTPTQRLVPAGLAQTVCPKGHLSYSPTCQTFSTELAPTIRLNTNEGYPKLYYWFMSHFASSHIENSIMKMRLINVGLFAGLTGLLFAFLPPRRRSTLVLGTLAVMLPLGAFLVSTVNPSGWVITGCAVAWLATVGYFEATPLWRKITLAAIALAGVLMSAGTRGDGAVYVALAVIAGTVLAASRTRSYLMSLVFPLPVLAAAIALFFAKDAKQLEAVVHGVMGSAYAGASAGKEAINVGPGLLFHNLLQLPDLWLGAFGGGGHGSLGWFDVPLPYLVSAGAMLAFGGIVFWGLRDMNVRKAVTLIGIITVITVVPLWFLQQSHFTEGSYLQPRYLYPGIVVLAGVAVFSTGRHRLTMSYAQMGAFVLALVVAYGSATYAVLTRYVDAAPDAVFFNIDSHRQWWWSYGWLPDPMKFWLLSILVFAAAAAISVFSSVPHAKRVIAVVTEPAPAADVDTEPDVSTLAFPFEATTATEPLATADPAEAPTPITFDQEPSQAISPEHRADAATEPITPLSDHSPRR